MIAVALAAGVESERRAGERAERAARRILALLLFVVTPIVVFFNLARLEITAEVGAGIGLGLTALVLAALIAWIVARRLLRLQRPSARRLAVPPPRGET